MLFEILSTSAAAALVGISYLKRTELDDGEKIKKISLNCGLYIKEGKELKTIQLYRKKKHEWGTEYIYRIPLGLSFSDFEKRKDHLRDGLNNRKGTIEFKSFTQIKLKSNPIRQIKDIYENRYVSEKDVELSYDGMLHIKVLDRHMPSKIIFDESMLKQCIDWEVPLGETRYGFINHNMERGHITLAGATRKGKTVLLKLIISSLINQQPDNTKLTLIDLKGGLAFTRFRNAKQVIEVATNLDEALSTLLKVKNEMEQMKGWFDKNGSEDIKEAGIDIRHFIIIDEAAQISPNIITGKEEKEKARKCEEALSEIARIGAGLGYRLIYCSQYPTADVMNKQIKQNCDTVITYKLRDAIASRVVLDESGAEKLEVPGRAIYKTPDGVQIVQTPFIENEQIEKIITPHIVIKPRKEDLTIEKTAKSGGNTFKLEEI
ncbi:FtsK/SpoIIIE domain-containing protein [Bacillus sp. S/N-304-OC-R1]|uniref:FtsK/SpoIIIE domain-containing protein n=1 Tax=Bacillus sp. S/N-304-OC-R1 TaxID=2758034 RepID=UPI001C8EC1C7|nr:FtsK/SpoIIIE domain-containing protein [Bacillus sp. S/N-304-OC-R1]MBY0122124.1 cell division protein FtsK [Bacillus sp. S/N-304-OC-R1]